MVSKKSLTMQSVHIAKTGIQPVRPKVMAFTRKIECKKYPKAVWNSMTKEQYMQVHKFHKQQGIKPAVKQISADARIAALEAKFVISSQPEEGDVSKNEEKTPNEPMWRRNRGNPVVTCQTLDAKHKKPG